MSPSGEAEYGQKQSGEAEELIMVGKQHHLRLGVSERNGGEWSKSKRWSGVWGDREEDGNESGGGCGRQ